MSDDRFRIASELATLLGRAANGEAPRSLPPPEVLRQWIDALLRPQAGRPPDFAGYLLHGLLTMAEITYRHMVEPPPPVDPGLLSRFEALLPPRPPALAAFAQAGIDPVSALRRALAVQQVLEPGLHSVLFVGDDDAASIALSLVAPQHDVWVLDIDARVLAWIQEAGKGLDCAPRTVELDVNDGVPFFLKCRYTAVVTDPPTNVPDCLEFLRFALACLSRQPEARLFWGDHPAWTHGFDEVLAGLPALGLACLQVLPELHRYPGAVDPATVLEDVNEWNGRLFPDGTPLAILYAEAALTLGLDPGWLQAVASHSSGWSHLHVLGRLKHGPTWEAATT